MEQDATGRRFRPAASERGDQDGLEAQAALEPSRSKALLTPRPTDFRAASELSGASQGSYANTTGDLLEPDSFLATTRESSSGRT